MGMENYDTALQMFVQVPRPVDMSRLSFLRWLAENGKLEHRVAGPSVGALAPIKISEAELSQPTDITKPAYLKKGRDGTPVLFSPTGSAGLRRTL